MNEASQLPDPSNPIHPVSALFVNARVALGADVAVHWTVIRAVDPAKCKVTVVTNSRSADHEQTMRLLGAVKGCEVLAMKAGFERPTGGKAQRILGGLANLIEMLVATLKCGSIARSRSIDLIHTGDRPRDLLIGAWLSRLIRRPHVIHVHVKWSPHMSRITRFAVERASGFIAISRFVEQSLVDSGIPGDTVHLVYNATDPHEFASTDGASGGLRERLMLSRDVPLIGLVGRIMVWKGHLDLLDAFSIVHARHPEVHLAFIGKDVDSSDGGPAYVEKVNQRIAELGLEGFVHWAGWFDEMSPVFSELTVACHPSWEEPFGLVVTEAMASGSAFVGYRSGALPEIVEDGISGLLVEPKDAEQLAAALCRLIEDEPLRRQLGESGRARVQEKFTPEIQAARLVEVFREIVAKR